MEAVPPGIRSAPIPSPLPNPSPLPISTDEAPRSSDLLVIGAGVMGAWTAFFAQAGGGGADGRIGGGRLVTLLDAWGAGHPRASSGDETRISRAAHGRDAFYTRWSRRALEQWRRYEQEWGIRLFLPSGVLWFGRSDDGFEARSAATLQALGIPHERLSADELTRRWPHISADETLRYVLHEPEAGTLLARRACESVVAAFQLAGGTYAIAGVRPGTSRGGRLLDVVDLGGRSWSAGSFVFACGPWLPRLFPELLGGVIRVTKQDVLYLGPPAGDRSYHWRQLPAWCDYGAVYYGVGATDTSGMKVAPDRYGPIFDPTRGERVVDPDSIRLAREYLRRRFPGMSHAPVIETRVCQYETTVDANFLLARHPLYDNVWLAGGGSGHGFKHGPRIGEYLVARLDGTPEGAQDGDEELRFRIGPRTPGSAARTDGDAMAATWDLF